MFFWCKEGAWREREKKWTHQKGFQICLKSKDFLGERVNADDKWLYDFSSAGEEDRRLDQPLVSIPRLFVLSEILRGISHWEKKILYLEQQLQSTDLFLFLQKKKLQKKMGREAFRPEPKVIVPQLVRCFLCAVTGIQTEAVSFLMDLFMPCQQSLLTMLCSNCVPPIYSVASATDLFKRKVVPQLVWGKGSFSCWQAMGMGRSSNTFFLRFCCLSWVVLALFG